MSLDLLNLNRNDTVRKILHKHTDEILLDEIILYSNQVTKINRKSKLQKRILVITNKAIYNFNDSFQLKRRISLKQIHTISVSSKSNDIVFHIPNEYDYLYRVEKKQIDPIIRIIHEYAMKLDHHINVLLFELDNLALIAENDKAKIPKNQSGDEYMETKMKFWQQICKISPYKQKHVKKGQISRRNLLHLTNHENEQKELKDNDQYHFEHRNEWKLGSHVEVYSNSKKKWYKGKIVKIYIDDLGEWLVIAYHDDSMEKDLQRNDKDLRPFRKQ